MKFVAYALLPALALANPLLVSIDTGSSIENGPSIQSGTCVEDLHYCGSYLIDHKGYKEADLKRVCYGDHCKEYEDLRESLYACLFNNHFEFIKHCRRGCRKGHPNQQDDHCNPAFADLFQIEV